MNQLHSLAVFCFLTTLLSPLTFCLSTLPTNRRLAGTGSVGVLARFLPDGKLALDLTDGEVVMSYELDPLPKQGVGAGVKRCSLAFDSMASFRILNDEKVKIESIGEEAIADLVDACNKISLWGSVEGIADRIRLPKFESSSEGSASASASLFKGGDHKAVTYPGTKWCGPGDRATNPDDLGASADVDACCRDHDLCPYNIKALQTRDHYFNTRPHTVSACKCDEAFFDCLKGVNENATLASSVGKAYFDLVGPPCVKIEVGIYCSKRHWTTLWCVETAKGLAAIAYKYLDGSWNRGDSVKQVLENLDPAAATPVPPIAKN